ncbi:glycosyltransferase family 1 protein [bacterium]|nr:MAG: glycosyltransferase family 1 protein [bacterium]
MVLRTAGTQRRQRRRRLRYRLSRGGASRTAGDRRSRQRRGRCAAGRRHGPLDRRQRRAGADACAHASADRPALGALAGFDRPPPRAGLLHLEPYRETLGRAPRLVERDSAAVLRVAFVDQTGDDAGGAEESLTLLLRNLPADIDPLVLLFHDGAYAQRLRALGLRTAILPVGTAISNSTREHPRVAGALGVPGAALQLARRLRRERIDAVHTNTLKAHVVGASAARLAGIPCVVHLRDILEGSARLALRIVAAACSRERIAISQAVARAYALPRTEVVPNPLDLGAASALPARAQARALLNLPQGVPLLGMIGRINRWKGHDRFLRAAAAVLRETAAHFAIVGAPLFRDADFVAELHTLVQDLRIAAHVTFLPWMADPRPAYAALDVLCNCSTREPFGRSSLEAAAARVPTICFDDGGTAELIVDGESGLVVPAGDEDALAHAMLAFARDERLRCAAGLAAQALLPRYDARSHAGSVAAILRRAAA